MKMFKTILLLLCISIMPSCSSDDSNNNNQGGNNSFFTKIDGEDFDADFASGFVTTFNTTITISGSDGNGKEVTLIFPITATAGSTYTIQSLDFVASYNADENDVSMANSEGSITITSHDTDDKRVSGTFNFVTEPVMVGSSNGYTFTEGSFNVNYTEL